MSKIIRLLTAVLIAGSVGVGVIVTPVAAFAVPEATASYPYRVDQEAYSQNGLQYGKFAVRVDDGNGLGRSIRVWAGVDDLQYKWFLSWYPNTYKAEFVAAVVLLRNGELFASQNIEHTAYGLTNLGGYASFDTHGLPGVYEIVVTPKTRGQYWGGPDGPVESDLFPKTESIKIAVANR